MREGFKINVENLIKNVALLLVPCITIIPLARDNNDEDNEGCCNAEGVDAKINKLKNI